jgi:hypothetical protein
MASWSTGSQIFEEIAVVIRANVSDYEARCDIYREIIPIFEDNGAELHDIYESVDEAFDEVWTEMYPQDDGDGW